MQLQTGGDWRKMHGFSSGYVKCVRSLPRMVRQFTGANLYIYVGYRVAGGKALVCIFSLSLGFKSKSDRKGSRINIANLIKIYPIASASVQFASLGCPGEDVVILDTYWVFPGSNGLCRLYDRVAGNIAQLGTSSRQRNGGINTQ